MNTLVGNGLVLGGRFRLVRQIGEGGMGVVWQAIEGATGRVVAIKFLRADPNNPELEKRFYREAEAANAVRHPCILHIQEIVRNDDGMPAFIMDLLDGEPLAARIERHGKLSLGQTAAILVPALQALQAAHVAGVVHRDLKPDNIFVTREQDGSTGVRVLDFGIARLTRPSEKLTVTGTLMGTPVYMSPEQAGGELVDARTDAWSMAALTFECLTGETPVTGDNYGQILSRLIRRDVKTLGKSSTGLPADVVDAVDALFVEKNQRAELSALEAVLARHADRSIEAPPLIAPGQSGRNVRDIDESSATMLDASTGIRPPTSRAVPAIVAIMALLVAVGFAAGTFALLHRAKQTDVGATSTISSVAVVPAAPPSVSVAVAAPVEPVVASAAPPPSASVAASAKRPFVKVVAAPSASASGPKRLSGGVADAPGF